MTNNIPQLALTAIYKIIDEEGGFVYTDHPVDLDRGTYAGIRYITFLNYMKHHNTDYSILTPTEFRKIALSGTLKKYVMNIYYEAYFQQMNLDALPMRMVMPVFSCGVNCGTRKSIKILQKSCNEMEYVRTLLKVDGINGERTSAFVHSLISISNANPEMAIDKVRVTFDNSNKVRNNFIKNWIHYYCKVVAHNPKQIIFLLGWFNRANKYWVV